MAYESVTIRDFMDAWFFQKFDKLSKGDFDICYSEYVDTTGFTWTEEFDCVVQINYWTNRLNSINLWVDLQYQYTDYFGEPSIDNFQFLKKFGYKIKWEGDVPSFFEELRKIKVMEARTQVTIDKNKKQLDIEIEKRKKNGEDEGDIKVTRVNFIKMLNSLGKIGYKIDKNETYVEELALMVKQQFEESEKYQYARGK